MKNHNGKNGNNNGWKFPNIMEGYGLKGLKTSLYIARHAESEYNRMNRIQGGTQSVLSELGKKQAKKLAKRMKNGKIDVIIASTLKRAISTAREIAKFHKNAEFVLNANLNERNYGIFEGNSLRQVEKEHPDFWKKFALSGNRHLYAPPKGESWLQVRRRAVPALKKILKEYEGKTIMVVAHGGLNRILLSELLSIPLKRNSILSQKNACVNLVEIGKGRVSFRIYNDTSHLNGLASPKNKTGF